MAKHNETFYNVLNVIKTKATKDNPISSTEITELLKANPDTKCDRKTVGRALDEIRAMYGMDEDGKWPDPDNRLYYKTTMRSSSPIYSDYYFEEMLYSSFEDYELFYLMEAVQFSPYIDKNFAEDIIKRLKEQCPNAGNAFKYHENVNARPLKTNSDFLGYLGDINTAINEDRIVSFVDNRYGVDKKLHPVSEVPVEVCPFRVVVMDGYYWLLCATRDSEAIRSYRVDRLTNVVVLDEIYDHNDARKKAFHNPEEYISEHRFMYSGETVEVTMVIDRSILGDVLESFGSRIRIDRAPADANRYTVLVRSGEKDIIDWVMRYGGYAVVTEPDYLRAEIRNRANQLSNCYRDEDEDIKYLEMIEKSERLHTLSLHNIDLNGRESYKNLHGIRRLIMSRNWIRDFSFLEGYTELQELTISHNEISDPTVLMGLGRLHWLTLENTGIKDLGFLGGNEGITRLTLHEFSLENIEDLYTLTNLKSLTVNKTVARLLDKARLSQCFGDSLRLIVSNQGGMMPLFMEGLPQRDGVNHIVRRYADQMAMFTTREVTDINVRNELCSDIYSGKGHSRDKLFSLVDDSCDKEERKHLYEDLEHYVGAEYVWYVTSEGDTVFDVSIFKRDHGLKLVGMARRNPPTEGIRDAAGRDLYEKGIYAWYAHIRYLMDNNICWCEISGELESAFRRVCTMRNLIDPQVFADTNVFRGVEIEVDDYHYYRKISGDKKTERKIAYGHIEVG